MRASAGRSGARMECPLVSIGVPTYNRPDLLARALTNISNQTWKNLEILVSDNCSSDPEVTRVIKSFSERDNRIRHYVRERNIGALDNFFFLLSQARAPYFMWAADDDYIASWFVERCMEVMLREKDIVLCTAETQYFNTEGELFPLVPQGAAFRRPTGWDRLKRMEHLIRNNFDNLIYGLFRREALVSNGQIFWTRTYAISNNEIPPLLAAAYHGEIVVLPDAGIFKRATLNTYAQAVWEERGGRLPTGSHMKGWRAIRSTWRYHDNVIRAVRAGVEQLDLEPDERRRLVAMARSRIRLHFLYMLARYKPASAPVSQESR